MNRRRFASFCLAAALPHCLPVASSLLFAQNARERRPAADNAKFERPPVEIQKILVAWENESAKFQRLEGDFTKWQYDFVFLSEKRTKGNFCFEAPDKGRIDFEPWNETSNPRAINKGGNKLSGGQTFKVSPGKAVKWISDGEDIAQVDVDNKQIDIFPIPKQIQGAAITESPLPFLFGMKAGKAEKRYKLELGPHHGNGRIHLIAYPRLPKDAANWKRAEVMLDARTFYPTAIKLADPSGNGESVYSFTNVHQPNAIAQFFGRDPFNTSLIGYKRIVHSPAKGQQGRGERQVARGGDRQVNMPRLIGQHWKKTKEILEKAGYEVKLRQGEPAPRTELIYHIYEQFPSAGDPLTKDKPVVLTLYNKPKAEAGPARRTSARQTTRRRR